MKEFTYVITDKEGIHARPAGELVKLAKSYASSVSVIKKGKKADAKKVFGLMGLGHSPHSYLLCVSVSP